MKVAGPEESSRIVTHENVPFPMEIMTEWAQSLQIMKMWNGELYLKEATVIYGFQTPGARLPKLASKLERLNFHLFKQAFNWLLVRHKIVEVNFTEMIGDSY